MNSFANAPHGMRLIQGSHIVVPKLYDGDHAYILQNEDRRIVFVIPYLGQFSLIGTTDQEYHGDPTRVQIATARSITCWTSSMRTSHTSWPVKTSATATPASARCAMTSQTNHRPSPATTP